MSSNGLKRCIRGVVSTLLLLTLGTTGVGAAQQTGTARPRGTAQQPGTSAPPTAEGAPATPANVSPAEAQRMAWDCLKAGVAGKSADHRSQAVMALGDLGARGTSLRLIEAGLQDKNYLVRAAAVTTLGNIKSRGSIPKLRVALDDSSPVVSFAAAQALWNMGDYSGASIFVQVLVEDRKTTPGLVNSQWHDMTKELHDPTGLAELGAAQAAGVFLGPGGFAVSAIEDFAKDKTYPVRSLSARMLGADMDPGVLDALEYALHDKNALVRGAAAQALGGAGNRSDIALLVPLLADGHPEARYRAAVAIVRLAARSA